MRDSLNTIKTTLSSTSEKVELSQQELLINEPQEIHILCDGLEKSTEDSGESYSVNKAPSLGDCQAWYRDDIHFTTATFFELGSGIEPKGRLV